MTDTWWFGSLGLLAIEGSYLPQLMRLYRLKQADEISYLFPALNLFGRLFAFAYSVSTQNAVFTIGFFVGSCLRLVLLVQVAWYRRNTNLVVSKVAS